MMDEKIKNSSELEFAVFCIENVAAKLGVDAERVYQAFTEQSDILNGSIVPEYEVRHTQSLEYIVDDLLDVMKERGGKYDPLSRFLFRDCQTGSGSFPPQCRLWAWLLCYTAIRTGGEVVRKVQTSGEKRRYLPEKIQQIMTLLWVVLPMIRCLIPWSCSLTG